MAQRWQLRHDRTGYYAQRLEETLTSRFCRVFCSIFLALLLIAGLILFILWLSLRPHRPRFHVTSFTLAGLSQEGGAAPTGVTFDVILRNPNRNIGIFYDDAMRGSLFYREGRVGVAPQLLPPFYQPPKNTTEVRGEMAGGGDAWVQMRGDAAERGQVWFRLEMVVTIRFRVSTFGDTRRHTMHADCDVGVGAEGSILPVSKNKRCSLYFA